MKTHRSLECFLQLTQYTLKKISILLLLLLLPSFGYSQNYELEREKAFKLALISEVFAFKKACRDGVFDKKSSVLDISDFQSAEYLLPYLSRTEFSDYFSDSKVIYNTFDPSEGIRVIEGSEEYTALVVFLHPGEDGLIDSIYSSDHKIEILGDDRIQALKACDAQNPFYLTRLKLANLESIKECFDDNNCTVSMNSREAFLSDASKCSSCFKMKDLIDGWHQVFNLKSGKWVSSGPDKKFDTLDDISIDTPLKNCEVFYKVDASKYENLDSLENSSQNSVEDEDNSTDVSEVNLTEDEVDSTSDQEDETLDDSSDQEDDSESLEIERKKNRKIRRWGFGGASGHKKFRGGASLGKHEFIIIE